VDGSFDKLELRRISREVSDLMAACAQLKSRVDCQLGAIVAQEAQL